MRFTQQKKTYFSRFDQKQLVHKTTQLQSRLQNHRPNLQTIVYASTSIVSQILSKINKNLQIETFEKRKTYTLEEFTQKEFEESYEVEIVLRDNNARIGLKYDANKPRKLAFEATNLNKQDETILHEYKKPTLGIEIKE